MTKEMQDLAKLLNKFPLLANCEGLTAEVGDDGVVEFRDYKGALRMMCDVDVYNDILNGRWEEGNG